MVQTSSISLTLELGRYASTRVPAETYWIRNSSGNQKSVLPQAYQLVNQVEFSSLRIIGVKEAQGSMGREGSGRGQTDLEDGGKGLCNLDSA